MTQPNALEQFMLELVNAERSKAGAQPLAFDDSLNVAAENHSQWMLDTDTFSHTGVGGSSPGTRMSNAGYVFSGSWAWGENIAWQGTTGTLNLVAAIDAEHAALFQSQGHRENILNDTYQELGCVALRRRVI